MLKTPWFGRAGVRRYTQSGESICLFWKWGPTWNRLALEADLERAKVPFKVNCFSWLVTRKACLTCEKLQRRGWHLSSRCFLCKATDGNNSHLFIRCGYTSQFLQRFLILETLNGWYLGTLLSFWLLGTKQGLMLGKRYGGELFLLVFGGLFGWKGMTDVFKIRAILSSKLRKIAFWTCIFGVKDFV